MRYIFTISALLLFIAGCASAPHGSSPSDSASSDVLLEGQSILGAWVAVGAPDQADIDDDIREGILTRMLVVNPYGRVTLTGEDRRENAGQVTYEGRLAGSRLAFDDLPGVARLELRDTRTLQMTDPGGNRTVYRRVP